jgi:hypothetical protein
MSYRISKSISFTSYNNYYAMISLLLLPLVYYYCTTSYASCAVISLFDTTNTVAKPILLHYLLRLLRHDIPAIAYRPATNYSTHDTYNKNIVRSRMHLHITLTLETLVHAHRTPPPPAHAETRIFNSCSSTHGPLRSLARQRRVFHWFCWPNINGSGALFLS